MRLGGIRGVVENTPAESAKGNLKRRREQKGGALAIGICSRLASAGGANTVGGKRDGAGSN